MLIKSVALKFAICLDLLQHRTVNTFIETWSSSIENAQFLSLPIKYIILRGWQVYNQIHNCHLNLEYVQIFLIGAKVKE